MPRFKWWRFLANFHALARASMFEDSAMVHFGVERCAEPKDRPFVDKY
ncbi:MAG: hypothetical protein GY772_12395, partial [bacterium]|nr:hypothetical protein [bacterium]